MANVTQTPVWEDGIYQIETTDPVMGGPEGISNKQAKQLANRTLYLKQRADEVDGAKGGFGSLDERLDQYDLFSPDSINALAAAAMKALHLGGGAAGEITRLKQVLTQKGEVTIVNRGVVKGCTVTKSASATRNLSLATGLCFYGSRLVPAAAAENVAIIPSNLSDAAASCYCYLIEDGGVMRMICTEIGEVVPDEGLPLYRVNIPANNTSANDPQATAVTLTDIRRIEAKWPTLFITAPYANIALQYPFLNADYSVSLDVIAYEGGGFQEGKIYVGDRAANGFKIYMNGTIDQVQVRWTVSKKEA